MSVLVLTVTEQDLRRILREEIQRVLPSAGRTAEDRRVTAAEAAAAAGLAVGTIRTWASAGRIHAFGEGRAVRYSLAEVLAVRPSPKEGFSPEARAEEIRRRHG